MTARQRHQQMQALAAAGFHEALQAQLVQQRFHQLRTFDHRAPRQIGVRIEVEHHVVGPVEQVGGGASHMQFDDAHLRRAGQALRRLDHHQRAVFGVDRRIQRADAGNRHAAQMSLEKMLAADALRATQQIHRPLMQKRQQCRRHIGVVLGQVELA